jgi:hypothetical protein
MTGGDELEMRLARMTFWQGSFARSGVDLQRHYLPDPLLITDLDLLAYSFTPQLVRMKLIGEAKSGTGRSAPKPLDRVIWLAGLQRLVDADQAILISSLNPSVRVRDLGRSVNVTALSTADLQGWEQRHLTGDMEDCGSQGPSMWEAAKAAHVACKGEPSLERAYWALRSELWFLNPWQAAKRVIGILDEATRWWTPKLDDAQQAALRWICAESLSILGLQLTTLVGIIRSSSPADWRREAPEKLAEGLVPAPNMRALSDAFDKYLVRALTIAKADQVLKVESMGAFIPQPPAWTSQFVELLERLDSSPGVVDLPRHLDLVIYERLVRRRHVDPNLLAWVGPDPAEGHKMRAWIAAFLRSVTVMPEAIQKALAS